MIDKRIFCYPSVRIGLGGSEKVCRGKREGGLVPTISMQMCSGLPVHLHTDDGICHCLPHSTVGLTEGKTYDGTDIPLIPGGKADVKKGYTV